MDIKKFIETIPEIKRDCDIYVNKEGNLAISIDDKTTIELQHGLFDCDNCYFSGANCSMDIIKDWDINIRHSCVLITKNGHTGIWVRKEIKC